jgi:hypothetical protein
MKNEMIKKDSLNQSIEIISDIKLNEADLENIFEEFKFILNNSDLSGILEKVSNLDELLKERDLKTIMKELSRSLSLNELNQLLERVIKNEKFVDFIQDLFLEKIL